MKRQGKTLKVLQDGDPRRMSDGKNAWRKMSPEQRVLFVQWLYDTYESGDCPVGDSGNLRVTLENTRFKDEARR